MLAPEKPFFLYYAPGACHAPHHAPKEWIDRFKGRFDMGYEAMREQTLARQKELGIVPPDTELPPMNPIGTPETADRARTASRSRRWTTRGRGTRCRPTSSGCSAAWRRSTPASWRTPTTQIGRLLDYLEETGQRENTIVVLVSDNGASGEGGPNGSVNENKFANGIPDDIAENLAMLDELGGPKTYNHYPNGWAMAFNTPFKMWKRYEFNGGTSDPCIISWPAGHRGQGRDPRPVPPRDRPRPDDPRRARRRAARDDRRPRPEPLRRRQHALQLRRRDAAQRPRDAVLLDARLAQHLARRLEGRHARTRRSAAGATSARTRGSSTTPTSTAPSCTTSPRRSPSACRS